MTNEETKAKSDRTKYLFDQISIATYYGMAMRMMLTTNPAAAEAAEKLVAEMLKANIPGMSPDPRDEVKVAPPPAGS